MSNFRRWPATLALGLWIVLTLLAWNFLAPTQVGGQASYIIVYGNSMEPNFHLGDLVVVQKASEYKVGEAVAYRNAELSNNVFHRIIRIEDKRFYFQGDNNSWVDTYQPAQDELIGKFWLYIPGGGKVIMKLRKPVNMALAGGGLGIILIGILMVNPPKGKRRMNRKAPHQRFMKTGESIKSRLEGLRWKRKGPESLETSIVTSDQASGPGGEPQPLRTGISLDIVFLVLGLFAFISIALLVMAFKNPATRTVSDTRSYKQMGVFSYSANVPAGVYDSNTVETGNPIFPKLTCSVDLGFQYFLVGEKTEGVAGSYQLDAQIMEVQSGWQRTLPLVPLTSFTGNNFNLNTRLDLCQIETIVSTMEAQTDFQAGSYLLKLVPHVEVNGKVDGQALQDAFEPPLEFRFNDLQFYVANNNGETDLFQPTQGGSTSGTRVEANTFTLLGLKFNVPATRVASILVLLLSLGGLAAAGIYISGLSKQSRDAFLRLKYEPILVDVKSDDLSAIEPTVDVPNIDDLAKLAERYNSMILHETGGLAHQYIVHGDGVTYRYSLEEANPQVLNKALSLQRSELQRALSQDEFQVYYQPIVSLTDGHITGVEALMRWQHPEHGMISAGEFIPLAENAGLINELDEWMLQVACTQLKGWQESGLDLKLAVNLSDHNLKQNSVGFIQRVLQQTGLDPQSLQIEIPENKVLGQTSVILPQLQELKSLGINIAIDNFVGQSTFSSFGQLPISSIKIDRLSIERITNSAGAASIHNIIALATHLGLDVVAQGVETDEQRGFLNEQACPQAQGYLLGKPVPANEMIELLKTQNQAQQSPRPKRSKSKQEKE